MKSENESCSVISNSLRPPGLYSPWNSPGQNAVEGSYSLLREIFPTQKWSQVSHNCGASLVVQSVKPLPAMRETRVPSLGWENPLEKEMATHSGTLAWKIPWTEKPGRLQSMWLQTVGNDWATSVSLFSRIAGRFFTIWATGEDLTWNLQ